MTSKLLVLLAVVGSSLCAFPAAAEPEPAKSRLELEVPERSWGYWVVLPSIIAGSTLTAYGLSIDCAPTDTPCHRRAGLAIWGGIGVVSLGSALGIAIVESGGRPSGVAFSGTFP